MRILITGGTGFIGTHFILKAKKEYEIIALVRASTNTKFLTENNIEYKIYRDYNDLHEFLLKKPCDGAIHFASLYLKSHASSQIDEMIGCNLTFSTNVIEACAKSGVKWFINTGTFWQHYDNKEYSPVNLYAATKQAFQDILVFYRENFQIRITTLKINDSYGPGDIRPKIMNYWKKIAGTGEVLKMSPGGQLIDMVYVDDIVSAFSIAISLITSNDSIEESYMISSRERITLRELAAIFSESTKKDLHIIWGTLPYGERENMIPWDSGILLPGWVNNTSLSDGIKKFYYS